ncbi:GumC family protein [Pectinatus sottacetonis]|uniref:GumC family protein n=1 Tax=Pectinatus sottacetonis TaxID=1002795 RepID=UPI0018C4EE92|nr:GumC family protein [Pectinatus sottacetonis]
MEKEESIDLRILGNIIWQKKKMVSLIIIICTLLALILAFVLPKTYESTTLVQTRTSGVNAASSTATAAAAALGISGNMDSPTLGYIEMMKSRTVLDPIIAKLDMPKEKKAELTAKDFAKKSLDIQNTKGTDLITVMAKGRTPQEAQQISKEVVDNFLLLMTKMNKQTQSLIVTFLSGRIDQAKKDSDDAAQKLEDFSKQTKVYGPDDQAKAVLEQLAAFDKTIGEMEVQRQSAQAQLDSTSAQLKKQNANAREYNVSDNKNVLNLRDSIVAKEVELVGLRQKYTDKHPSVIAAQNELAKLRQSLNSEVASEVSAGTTTLSPLQSTLAQGKAQAQVNIAVANASEAAVKQLEKKAEGSMSSLSDNILQYTKLKRDADIKNEVYLNLVKSCEQAKIQQAMQSMDIQVVDPANLPKKPSAPRKLLITIAGFIIGMIGIFAYSMFLYMKLEK